MISINSLPDAARASQPSAGNPQTSQANQAPPDRGDPSPMTSSDASYHPQLAQLRADAGSTTAEAGTSGNAPASIDDGYLVEQPAALGETPAVRIAPLDAAQTEYAEAKAKVDELDKQLGHELAEVGPSLTDEQRNAYADAFHQKHAPAYEAEKTAAQNLKAAINDPRTDQAAAQHPECARQVVDAVKQLAGSSEGQAALDWLAARFGSATPGASAATTPYGQYFSDSEIAATIETAAVSAAGTAAGDPRQAAKDTLESLQFLANAGVGGSAVTDAVKLYAGVVNATDRHALVATFEDASRSGTSPRFMAAAYVMASAMVSGDLITGIGDTFEDKAKFIGDLALTAQGGLEAAGELLKSGKATFIETASGIARAGAWSSGEIGKALVRYAPILGGIASAFYIAADAKGLLDDPTWLKTGTLVGDVMSLALLVPGAQLVGLIGIGIAAICSMFSAEQSNSERVQEETELLRQAGLGDEAATTIANNSDAARVLASSGGVGPEQIQALAASHPSLFEYPDRAQAFSEALVACQLTGDKIVAFADAMAGSPDGEGAFGRLASDMHRDDGGKYSASWIVAHLSGDNVYSGAKAYLEANRPLLVTEAGARARADGQYDAGQAGGMDGVEFSARLGDEDNAVYRAQLVKNAQEAGALGSLADDIAASGSDEDKALLAQSINDAYKDGVLTAEQANEQLTKLGAPEVVVVSAPTRGGGPSMPRAI